MTSLVIFLVILFIVTALLIWATFKNVASGGVKIVLTLVILFCSLIVGVIGLSVWGLAEFGSYIGEEISKEQEQATEKGKGLRPVLAETGESKDIYVIGDTVRDNGIEFTLNEVTKSTEGLFAETDEYCKLNFTLKNITEDTINISNWQFEVRDSDGAETTELIYSVPDDEDLFKSNIDLLPEREITKFIAVECNSASSPYRLEVNVGSLLSTLTEAILGGEEATFKPIVVEFSA